MDTFDAEWGYRYPAAIRLWRNAWEEFIPFLDYDTETRKVICSTNAIESLNARYRRAIRVRGHFLLVTWNQIGLRGSRPEATTELGGGLGGSEVGRQVAGARPT